MVARFKDKQWRSFYLSEFFSSEKGNQNNMASLTDGNIPLVSARKINNGYKDFVSPNGKKLFDGNIITLNNDGDGGAGIAYYQPSPFALDTHVTALTPRINMSYHVLLFVAGCITKQRSRFGHGYPINDNRLKKFIIMLPVCDTDTSKPDWTFMEAYMQQVEQAILKPTIEELKARITDAPKPIWMGNWKAFRIDALFNIRIGKNIDGNKADKTGNIAYITRKETNNGLDGFINGQKSFLNQDYPVITIGNETIKPFVQRYPFFTGTKVNILCPKERLSFYVLQFIATSIEQHRSTYSYSFTMNSTRLKAQVILLPITSDGTPDWQYMEAYMKYAEQEALKQTVEKLSNRIVATPCH